MNAARRSVLAGVVALLALSGSAADDEREVMGDELAALLTDRSIEGVWGERPYVQWFAPSGRTGYRPQGGDIDWGTWRIGSDGRYCSTWRGGGEACYPVVERGGQLYWLVVGSGRRHPFTVVDGNRLQP